MRPPGSLYPAEILISTGLNLSLLLGKHKGSNSTNLG